MSRVGRSISVKNHAMDDDATSRWMGAALFIGRPRGIFRETAQDWDCDWDWDWENSSYQRINQCVHVLYELYVQ